MNVNWLFYNAEYVSNILILHKVIDSKHIVILLHMAVESSNSEYWA